MLRDAASKREMSFIVSSFVSRRPRTIQGLSARPQHHWLSEGLDGSRGDAGSTRRRNAANAHIRALLAQSLCENDYSDLTDDDFADARKAAIE